MKKLLFILGLLSIGTLISAQIISPFKIRKTVTQKGGIIYLSNTSSKASPDNIIQNEMPPAGTGYDNNFTNTYVDIDGDPSTFMSSSDQLNLPNCSEITWAGLYWGADCSAGDENYATRNQVKLKVNNGSYINITADNLFDNVAGFKTYHCFKDVTSILSANSINDRYTIANVATDINGKNLFGGWTIVIIYKNSTMTMRNLTVFEGLASVSQGAAPTVDIPISGFQTPLTGPVTFELGLVVYDGDRSLTGDQLMFKGASGFVNVFDGLHSQNDVFNSTLSRNGVLTPRRNPSYNNTLGYDANIFVPNNTAKNYIGNNAISATIRQTTGGETYLTQVVTSAIDVYEPDLRSAVRVKNITHPGTTTAEKGDILEYLVNGLNIGSDPSVNTFITDTIEGNAQYVPGSIVVTYGPNSGAKTDATGDDQAEYISSSKTVKVRIGTGAGTSIGGIVNNSPVGTDSTQFSFRVQATTDCVFLACDAVIDNSAHIIGTGKVSGNTFSNASNPGVFNAQGCPISGTTKTPINTTGCSAPTASANSPICQGGTINFTATESPSATYLWTGPNNFTSQLREPVITNVTAANAGTYTANIFVNGKTCHFTYSFNANINIASAGPDQTGNSTCGLTTVTLAGNNPPGATGIWTIVSGTGGDFGSGHTATSSVANTTFNGVPGNSYTLRWSLSSVGCDPSSDDVNIRFNQNATASVLSGSSTVCYNGYANLKVAITGGASPYTVTLNNGGGTFTGYISGNDLIVGPLTSSKTFSLVSVTDANGCVSSGLSGSATVTVADAITGTGIISQLNPPVSGGGPKTSATASGSGWVNVTNTIASDNSYTTVTQSSGGNSNYLYLSNFGFSVPAGSTIVGVESKVERSYTATGTRTISGARISLQSNSTLIGSNQSITYPLTTDATLTTGGSTNMWGATTTTLTPAIVNNSNFGVRLRITASNSGSGSVTARIDYVTLKIYYTPASSYCDDASSIGFSVATYTNATNYTWTAISGGSVTSGQGTNSALMDFNGAGQSGSYNVCVVASNNCQTLPASCISIPVTDCLNSSLYLMGNVYWDKNAMTDNLVNGTPVSKANGVQLYVTLLTGTTAALNSIPVAANGTYKFPVSASTNYTVVLSTTSYLAGATPVASLPAGCSNTGEIVNNLTNTTTGNDGTTNGRLSVAGFTTNNKVNVNFGIKISTPPVAVNDVISTNEDTPVNVNVTSNDTDEDGTIDVATVDLNPSSAGIQNTITNVYGVWSVNASGVVNYSPAANFNGNANVTYTVNDNDNNTSNTGTLMVTVIPVNDPPTVSDDFVSTQEDTPVTINVLLNDTDPDGTIDVTTVDLNPAVPGIQSNYSVAGEGTYEVNSTGDVLFTPFLNFNGTATPIHYTVKDDLGAMSASASLTVTITSVIDPPVALNDNGTTQQNTPVTINILSNDVGVDAVLNPASIDLDPLTAGIQSDFSVPGEGAYHANISGTVTFTPIPAYFGTTTPANYRVSDNLGHSSNIASLQISVIGANAPLAVNDLANTNQNVTVTVDVTANDNAPNGSINKSRIDLDPFTPGFQQSYDIPSVGTFIADILGIVTFQPAWDFYGTAVGRYTVIDNLGLTSNIATITITVIQVNQPPVTNDDILTGIEDTPLVFNVLTNDSDPDGTVMANSVDLDPSVAGRQTTFTVTGEGTYSADNAGNVTFTPVLNFNGQTTPVPYIITDNQGLSSDVSVPGMISITVTAVNDAPVAVNDVITAPSNSDVTVSLLSNDSDVDGTINPASVDLNPSFPGIQNTIFITGEGTYTVDNSGLLTFQPLPAFVGPVTATTLFYTVNDDQGATSNIASLVITLSDPSAPQAINDNVSMNEDGTPVTIDILANDVSGSGNIVVNSIDLNPSTVVAHETDIVNADGHWQVNTTTGIVTFTPAADFNGTATLSYVVYDDNTVPLSSNPATITVTVLPVNDIPSFVKGSNQTLCANSDVQILNNWATALSAGSSNESSQLLSFTVTNNNNSLFSSQPDIDPTGTLSFELAPGQSGTATVSVTIKDDGGQANGGVDHSAVQTFTITVNAQAAPTIGLITQPTCATTTGAVVLNGLPASGTWTLTSSGGTITTGTGNTYSFTGLAPSTTYTFKVTNSSGCTSVSSSGATLNDVPSAPAVPTASAVIQPGCGEINGSITFNSQPAVEYSVGGSFQASNNFANLIPGTYTLRVRSTTDNTCITQGSSLVTINNPPAVPLAPAATSSQSFCTGISPKVSDILVTGSNIIWYTAPTLGTVVPQITPLVNGTTYYASQTVLCESSSRTPVTVTILSCTGPDIINHSLSIDENTLTGTMVYDVNDNNSGIDKDVDGNILSYSITGGNTSGAFAINAITGQITVADGSKLDYETITTFNLTVRASNGTITDDAIITVNLLNLNDNAPVSVNDSYSLSEGASILIPAPGLLTNDTDQDGNTLTAVKVTDPLHGSLVLNSNGSFTYTHDGSETISDSFTYKANDGVNDGNIATVTITVTPVNDPPVAQTDTYTVNEGGTLTVSSLLGVLKNDSDPEASALTSILVTSVSHGTLTLNSDGSFTYVHDGSETTSDSFEYKVNDGTIDGNTVAVSINVTPVNDPPVISDFSKTENEDNTIVFAASDFTSVFTDAEGNTITKIKITSLPLNGTLKLSGTSVNVNDEILFSDIANLTFVPDPDWNGITSFGWNGYDGTDYASLNAKADITIIAVNDPPVVTNFARVIEEGNILNFSEADFKANYTDKENSQLSKVKITSLPLNGTLKLSGTNVNVNDEIFSSTLGNLTFTPDANWSGATNFGWNGSDGTAYALAGAIVNITVNSINHLPVVSDFTKTTDEDNILTFSSADFTGHYSEADANPLARIKITSLPLKGILKLSGVNIIVNDEIPAASLGLLTYTPEADWNGTITFRWNGYDGTAYALTEAVVTVIVNSVNDSPVLASSVINVTMNENGAAQQIDISGNVTDVDGNVLTTTIATGPSHGNVTVSPSGDVTYTPDKDFSGSDSFTYRVCDDGTPSLCVEGSVNINVVPVAPSNHLPSIAEIVKTTPQNTTLKFATDDFVSVFSDSDNDTLSVIQITSLPTSGTLKLNGVTLVSGQEITWIQLKKLEFIPATDFTGEVSFNWKASDGKDYSAVNDVIINVTPQEVFIPEGFSPNGDGVNDFFIIRGTDNYKVSVSFYNRWGNLVYENKNYKNDWEGNANTGLLIGSKLPDGTYFYVINLNNGEKPKAGYITINR